MTECLEVRHVSKSYPNFKLNDVSFSLPKGYIMGLIGSNGAGKTTMIQLILNMIERDEGEICVFGKDNIESEGAIKQELGAVFDRSFYVDAWTVDDVEKAVSIFYNNWDHQEFTEALQRFGLSRHKKVEELSRGMQTKLMLACAFSHKAKLLILDEPTSGLDPATRDDLLENLQEYIQDGERSVLFSTHITSDLERAADYITLLNKGDLVYTGSVDDLILKYRIVKGRLSDLDPDLERYAIGLRKTSVGFEALFNCQNIDDHKNLLVETPTVNDIAVYIGKEN